MLDDDLRIVPERAALLVVDFQERLAAAMPAAERAVCERNVLILLELARRVAMPVVVSEQYPKGLGQTVEPITRAVASLTNVARFEKLAFACTETDEFRALHDRLAPRQWIVTGMEAHVCVWQTVRGLRGWGASVHVPADAVLSRAQANVGIGLGLMARAGAVVTSTETIAFDALTRAGGEDFKAISRLVR